MATLQRFKIMTTQCGVSTPSPRQSPSTSPLIQFRRGKTTLKMLLSLRSPNRREQPLIHHQVSSFAKNNEINNKNITRRKLRDLFVSSSSLTEEDEEQVADVEKERRKGKTKEEVLAAMAANTPVWFGSSKRIIQRGWRPRLGTIPEY